jgi:hypothetical protein
VLPVELPPDEPVVPLHAGVVVPLVELPMPVELPLDVVLSVVPVVEPDEPVQHAPLPVPLLAVLLSPLPFEFVVADVPQLGVVTVTFCERPPLSVDCCGLLVHPARSATPTRLTMRMTLVVRIGQAVTRPP